MQKKERFNQDKLGAYLPRTPIHGWHVRRGQPQVWRQWPSGSPMRRDISGFAAISKSLARLDSEGGELMADVLDGFSSRMLEGADRWWAASSLPSMEAALDSAAAHKGLEARGE